MITLITWAPFLLVAILCGAFFMVLGYKRGSLRAAVSVIMTVVSSVIAIVIAKLVAIPVGKLIADKVVDVLTESSPEIADLGRTHVLAEGIAGAASALVLYIPIFIIVCAIIKPIVSAIMSMVYAKAANVCDSLGGMTIALIDTLLLAFLITLPLYGTVAIVGEVSETAEIYIEKEAEKADGMVTNGATMDIVRKVTDAPIVTIASNPPFSTAYDVLLTFKFEGSNVNLSKSIRTVASLAKEISDLSSLPNKYENKDAIISLLNKTEDFLLENEFVTDVACSFLSDKIPAVRFGDMEFELVEYYSAIADGELLREDLPAFVDLLEAILKSGMMEALEGEGFDMTVVDAEMVSGAFGKTFNNSPAIAAFKTKIVKEAVSIFVDDLLESGEENNEAIIKLKDTVMNLPESPLSVTDATKEGEALYMFMSGILTGINDGKHAGKAIGMLIEGMARHPQINTDELIETAKALLSRNGLPATDKLTENIRAKLNESVDQPVGKGTFPDFCDAAFTTATTLSSVVNGEGGAEGFKTLITSSPEALETVKNTVTTELLNEIGMSEQSEKVTDIITSVFDAMIEADLSEEEAEKEAEALNQIMSLVSDVTNSETVTDEAVKERADALIEACAGSVVVEKTLTNLTEGGKTDPMGIFSDLGSEAKSEIKNKIDSYISENGESSTLSALKLFIGIK
jgi:hypothetical protein